jgi:hypothetical protein
MESLLPERAAAVKALREWAKVHKRRDEVIRAAVAAGIDHRTVQQITGVARTTIARIVGPGTRYRRGSTLSRPAE